MKKEAKCIRNAVIEDRESVAGMMLTRRQVMVYKLAAAYRGGLTSANLSHQLSMSIPSASAALKALWVKGYLTRDEKTDPTGGFFYKYKAVKL